MRTKKLRVHCEDGHDLLSRFVATLSVPGRPDLTETISTDSLPILMARLWEEWEIEWRGDQNEFARVLSMGYAHVAELYNELSS